MLFTLRQLEENLSVLFFVMAAFYPSRKATVEDISTKVGIMFVYVSLYRMHPNVFIDMPRRQRFQHRKDKERMKRLRKTHTQPTET